MHRFMKTLRKQYVNLRTLSWDFYCTKDRWGMRNLENWFRLDKSFGYFTYVYVLLSWKIPTVWRIRSSKKVQRVKNSVANFECCNNTFKMFILRRIYSIGFILNCAVSQVNTSSDSNGIVWQWEFIRIKWWESIEIQQDLAMRTFAKDISRVDSKIFCRKVAGSDLNRPAPWIFSRRIFPKWPERKLNNHE